MMVNLGVVVWETSYIITNITHKHGYYGTTIEKKLINIINKNYQIIFRRKYKFF